MKLTAAQARERLAEVGLESGTVLVGSQTITIDTDVFDLLCRVAGCARTRDVRAAGVEISVRPKRITGYAQSNAPPLRG
jgi:hypothetical protein